MYTAGNTLFLIKHRLLKTHIDILGPYLLRTDAVDEARVTVAGNELWTNKIYKIVDVRIKKKESGVLSGKILQRLEKEVDSMLTEILNGEAANAVIEK